MKIVQKRMNIRSFGGWAVLGFFSEGNYYPASVLCVFSLFLLLKTVKEKSHKNVQYNLKCPRELTVALLGFEQFQFVSIPGF